LTLSVRPQESERGRDASGNSRSIKNGLSCCGHRPSSGNKSKSPAREAGRRRV